MPVTPVIGNKMKGLFRNILAATIAYMPVASFAIIKPFTQSDCPALIMPNTALLVHASWCSHCKAYKPTYEKVSQQDKYKDWVFYEFENDKFEKVCGTTIYAVPIIFKNNMQSNLLGNYSLPLLEKFLDN